MKRTVLSILVGFIAMHAASVFAQNKPELWFKFENRFMANDVYDLTDVDSVGFTSTKLVRYKYYPNYDKLIKHSHNLRPMEDGEYRLGPQERHLVQPELYYGNDFMNSSSTFCFERSAESEHFVVYWANGLKKRANGDLYGGKSSSVCNLNNLLENAEKSWTVYVEELGFLEEGKSTTDKAKINMYIVDQSEWRADGSGQPGRFWEPGTGSNKTQKNTKVGVFHCNAWASSSNVTTSHEIGHVFQYLVSADLGDTYGLNYVLGSGSGNEWWEDCANWQAHKVHPASQFAENWGNNQAMHHLNILHEDARYNNCYYQDWWCQVHGLKTIGRVWRETKKPEDPIQGYMRIFGYNTETFADHQFEGYAHIASMDINSWKTYGQGLIGSEQQRLVEVPAETLEKHLDNDKSWWIVDPAYCPQNYGYNANPIKVPAAGTVVKAQFKGLPGIDGYRKVNTSYAGWRYGFVAYSSDGTRTYGEMGRDKEGEVSITVPEKCTHMWFVVMGAPTTYWTHSWDDNQSNDEQWPYAVKFSGTDPYGASKTYGEFAEDYARKDTTVVINAMLAYSSSSYSSVRVQYDMDAISQALGLSTAQLKSAKVGASNSIRFVGVSANGAISNSTTTSTSSSTCFGHWFNASGNVCNFDSNARVFAEFYPDKYGCYVGQYPGRLTKGKTYTVRQAIVYKHTDGKEYKATMQINLKIM